MIEKIGYSIDETIEATSLGRTVVYELLRSGELESIKVGRRRIIPADAIRSYFDEQRAAQAADGGGSAA